MPGYAFRAIEIAETRAFIDAVNEAFQSDPEKEEVALWIARLEHDRTRVAIHAGAIVGTSGLFSLRLAVPGGVAPMAGVTAVGVHPSHRRRGVLDGMMRGLLDATHERGEEAISALWASEAGIYGRWGFGSATRGAEVTVRSPQAQLRRAPEDRPQTGDPKALLPAFKAVYAGLPRRPGLLERDELGWAETLMDLEANREGAGRLRGLVCDGGYATYAVRKRDVDGRAEDVVELRELLADGPDAAAVLWDHLIRLSLTRSVHWWSAAEDLELPHLLLDARAVTMRIDDGLYVRLVDVPRALTQRRYRSPVDVVLEVADAVCPWNAGRWRLAGDAAGATCEPTADPADLALTATELGAAYLGGTPLATLAAAGRVEEITPGALAATGHAFLGERPPWAFEAF